MKKEKFHSQMFKDSSSSPDNSAFLERGLHINEKGLKACLKHKEVLTDRQSKYIDIHLKSCPDCSQRLREIESRENLNIKAEERDLPF